MLKHYLYVCSWAGWRGECWVSECTMGNIRDITTEIIWTSTRFREIGSFVRNSRPAHRQQNTIRAELTAHRDAAETVHMHTCTCTHALLLWCKNPLLFCNDSHFLNQVLTSLELRLNNNTINNVVCVLLAYQILVAHTIVNNAQFCSVSAITPHRIAQQHHNNKG